MKPPGFFSEPYGKDKHHNQSSCLTWQRLVLKLLQALRSCCPLKTGTMQMYKYLLAFCVSARMCTHVWAHLSWEYTKLVQRISKNISPGSETHKSLWVLFMSDQVGSPTQFYQAPFLVQFLSKQVMGEISKTRH